MKRTLFRSALAALALCAMSSFAMAETTAPPPPAASASTSAPSAPAPSPAPTSAPAPAARSVRVRVLADCEHGKCNDVLTLPPDDAKALKAAGLADDSKAAVDYAATLPQNQPKPKTT